MHAFYISIVELAHVVGDVVGFSGTIVHDFTKPDGTQRKLLSTAKLDALSWSPKISLKDGILSTYQWFLEHECTAAR